MAPASLWHSRSSPPGCVPLLSSIAAALPLPCGVSPVAATERLTRVVMTRHSASKAHNSWRRPVTCERSGATWTAALHEGKAFRGRSGFGRRIDEARCVESISKRAGRLLWRECRRKQALVDLVRYWPSAEPPARSNREVVKVIEPNLPEAFSSTTLGLEDDVNDILEVERPVGASKLKSLW